jgi:nucleoside phosphorylase
MKMKRKTDILIYVALAEEFEYIIKTFTLPFNKIESKNHALTHYAGEIPAKDGSNKVYKITLVPSGTMGNVHSAVFASSLIDEFNPSDVVVIGIAGSLSNDLSPGDILIPNRVVDYMANSAGVGEWQNEYENSGNYYDCDRRLINRFQNFKISNELSYINWQTKTEENLSTSITENMSASLENEGISLPSKARLFIGDDRSLASGPTVGKGTAFAKWLKSKVDRKFAAVEMESAGVVAASLLKINGPRVLVLRGISDLATEKKSILEEIAGDNLRKMCMKNVVVLLQTAIEEGLFISKEKKYLNKKLNETPLIKKVFVIGGETGESGTPEYELDELRQSCRTIGRELAKARIELIVCSPFADSADYHAASGYADMSNGGVIHFHFPAHEEVISCKTILEKHLKKHCKKKCPQIVDWQHPTYTNKEAIKQAWLLCQLQALEQADAVVSIGGRASNSANTLLHLAEIWRLPIIPFTFLGGASKTIFDRINWKDLYPKLPIKTMENIDGLKKVVSLLRQLALENLQKRLLKLTKVSRIFISRAKLDAIIANEISKFLKEMNLDVILGDEAIVADRAAIPTIEEQIKISQLVIVLWSKNYALSPWCHDELMFAISRKNSEALNILIFNLDDTAIIPTEARNLSIISAHSPSEINKTLTEALKLD